MTLNLEKNFEFKHGIDLHLINSGRRSVASSGRHPQSIESSPEHALHAASVAFVVTAIAIANKPKFRLRKPAMAFLLKYLGVFETADVPSWLLAIQLCRGMFHRYNIDVGKRKMKMVE
jgi:hypothetical protein